jgi:hypothetical protein
MSVVTFHEGRPVAPTPAPELVKHIALIATAKLQHDFLIAAWSPAHTAALHGFLDGWHAGFAQGIEAATAAETVEHGSVHESPVAESDAPNLSRNPSQEGQVK